MIYIDCSALQTDDLFFTLEEASSMTEGEYHQTVSTHISEKLGIPLPGLIIRSDEEDVLKYTISINETALELEEYIEREYLGSSALLKKLSGCTDIPDAMKALSPSDIYPAAAAGYLGVVKYLNTLSPPAHPVGWSPITKAANRGRVEVVKYLFNLNPRHTPDTEGWTPLYAAINGGHLETVRFLLANGADPQEMVNGETSLNLALRLSAQSPSGDVEEMVSLLQDPSHFL